MDVNTTDLVLPAGLQDFLEENALICPPIPLAIFLFWKKGKRIFLQRIGLLFRSL